MHPKTEQLLDDFTKAFRNKLEKAEQKYGYQINWARSDWESECAEELYRHVEKGDPLDVAAYAAFAWYHNYSTKRQGITEKEIIDFIETWIYNPFSAYSNDALRGLFLMTRDRIDLLKEKDKNGG